MSRKGEKLNDKAQSVKLLSVPQAARQYNIAVRTLYSRISAGTLKAYEVKGRRETQIYINPQELQDWRHNLTRTRMTSRHTELLKLHSEGLMDVEIAASLGCSRERVRKIREALHLPKNPRKPTLPKTGASL
mgnify:FL=1